MAIPEWDDFGPAEFFAVYYVATAAGFLLVRILLVSRGRPKSETDSGGESVDSLWQVFMRGLNPFLAAALFPVFWPLVLALQVLLGRVLGRILVSNESEHTETSFGLDASAGLASRIGREGEALCDLHPSGRIMIGDDTLEAVTRGGFIHRGSRVRVIGSEGFRVVVEPND